MLSFWLKENASGRRRIVIIGLVMLLTAVVLNQLGQALIPVKRASPTLSFEHIYRVSELLHIPTKDASKDSFPGDHGMMLLIFSAFMLRYFGKTAGIIALIIFVVFAFPRVMIGAHWFTDIVVGSLTVILIGLPWWLMTPLSDRAIALFENYLPGGNKQILNK
ncbi:Inner membrane protein yeiU [Salmonella enterica subsp. enterica]|nr:Inner membrane protein yeiU [Salmonella enterica subsp. enterica]